MGLDFEVCFRCSELRVCLGIGSRGVEGVCVLQAYLGVFGELGWRECTTRDLEVFGLDFRRKWIYGFELVVLMRREI